MPHLIPGGPGEVKGFLAGGDGGDYGSDLWYRYQPVSMPHMPSVLRRTVLVSVLLATAGCGWLRPAPTPILPADELYKIGETNLEKRRYLEARESFKKIVERHPDSSYAARGRFLIGEAFYREGEFDKAIAEFRTFLSFYPRHQIADLVQYRLAMAYYDQIKPIEQDQGLAIKALAEFKKLVKEYPESRYAGDALAKVDICRGRQAQKELWVATYYFNQGNPSGARQRLELVLKEYPRTLVVPEALWLLGEVNLREGKDAAARELFRRLVEEYSYTDFGRRAGQRLQAQR
jgi:outer membrane protein assembly factor BamD